MEFFPLSVPSVTVRDSSSNVYYLKKKEISIFLMYNVACSIFRITDFFSPSTMEKSGNYLGDLCVVQIGPKDRVVIFGRLLEKP